MPRKADKMIMCGGNFASAGSLMRDTANGAQMCAMNMTDDQIDDVVKVMVKAMEKVEKACHEIADLVIDEGA